MLESVCVRMLKFYVCCFCFYLPIATVLEARNNSNTKITTSKPVRSFLDNFHQSDYKMAYEWAETVSVNQTYGDYKAIVFKYNRTTTALNSTLFVHLDLGYKVEVIAQAYKFASNEYRLFPMRFELNFCEAIKRDVLGTTNFAQTGNLSCPLLKGKHYTLLNWTPDGTKLPPFVPTGKYMMELQYMYHSNEVLLTRNYVRIYRPFTIYET